MFHCEICQKICKSKGGLTNHKKVHIVVEKEPVEVLFDDSDIQIQDLILQCEEEVVEQNEPCIVCYKNSTIKCPKCVATYCQACYQKVRADTCAMCRQVSQLFGFGVNQNNEEAKEMSEERIQQILVERFDQVRQYISGDRELRSWYGLFDQCVESYQFALQNQNMRELQTQMALDMSTLEIYQCLRDLRTVYYPNILARQSQRQNEQREQLMRRLPDIKQQIIQNTPRNETTDRLFIQALNDFGERCKNYVIKHGSLEKKGRHKRNAYQYLEKLINRLIRSYNDDELLTWGSMWGESSQQKHIILRQCANLIIEAKNDNAIYNNIYKIYKNAFNIEIALSYY